MSNGWWIGKCTKVVVAEENGQLHGLQRRVQLRQPMVSQLAGGQKVLRADGSPFRNHSSRLQAALDNFAWSRAALHQATQALSTCMSSASRSLAGSVGSTGALAAEALRCGRKAACKQQEATWSAGRSTGAERSQSCMRSKWYAKRPSLLSLGAHLNQALNRLGGLVCLAEWGAWGVVTPSWSSCTSSTSCPRRRLISCCCCRRRRRRLRGRGCRGAAGCGGLIRRWRFLLPILFLVIIQRELGQLRLRRLLCHRVRERRRQRRAAPAAMVLD